MNAGPAPSGPAELAGGTLVRPYALTRGRTRPRVELAIETLVRTTDRGRSIAVEVGALERNVLELAATPIAVAEVAARLGMVIGAARVVVGDLVAAGWLDRSDAAHGLDGLNGGAAPAGAAADQTTAAPHEDRSLLERVLDGLNAL